MYLFCVVCIVWCWGKVPLGGGKETKENLVTQLLYPQTSKKNWSSCGPRKLLVLSSFCWFLGQIDFLSVSSSIERPEEIDNSSFVHISGDTAETALRSAWQLSILSISCERCYPDTGRATRKKALELKGLGGKNEGTRDGFARISTSLYLSNSQILSKPCSATNL